MDNKKLIEALRTESRYKDKATLEIMDLCMEAADKLEELNNFEQSQCAKLLFKLAEKDKQLADAETQHRVEYCESTGYDCEVRRQLAAAVEDLRGLCWCCAHGEKWKKAPVWSNMTTCEHIRERGSVAVGGGKAGKYCQHWTWRGPQEAGEGGG